MTLQRSILTSVLIHFLIFGSAFAFARLGAGVLWSRDNTIEVTIVSAGSEKGKGGTEAFIKKNVPLVVPEMPDVSSARDEKEPEEVMPDFSVKPEQTARVIPEVSGSGNGAPAAGTEGKGREQGGEPGIGIVSPEQWSIIAAAIERNKNYPRMARERSIQGTVRLRFKVGQTGAVEKVEVLKSSGFEILDDASIKSVYRAKPLPYVQGWIEVPIAYVLK